MAQLKQGDRVVLPATKELPKQHATVLEVYPNGTIAVEIDFKDRLPNDRDGLAELSIDDIDMEESHV